MLGRFSPAELFRGHWKGLSDYRKKTVVPDVAARLVLVLVPLGAAAAVIVARGEIRAPSALLAGVALLAGGFLSVFTHLSTLRQKLTDRIDPYEEPGRTHHDRDSMDEAAAHLLLAAYLAGVTAALLVVGMNFVSSNGQTIRTALAAPIVLTGTYMFLLFLVALPKMYNAYASMHQVRDELSGTYQG